MIHVDVRPNTNGAESATHVVETSIDGSDWVTRFLAQDRRTAELVAVAFVTGARVAGAEARATSHGESL
jgi:hypothetical protein